MHFKPSRTHEIVTKLTTKPKRRTQGQEAKEQKRFVTWARSRGLEVQHQNNGSGSKARRVHLHAMGCTAGAADLLVFDCRLALEFKSPTGRQSDAQKAWQKRIEALGWTYCVVRSAEQAVDLVKLIIA